MAIFFEIPSWDGPVAGVTSLEDLHKDARGHVDRTREVASIPIDVISTGPQRDETITIRDTCPG